MVINAPLSREEILKNVREQRKLAALSPIGIENNSYNADRAASANSKAVMWTCDHLDDFIIATTKPNDENLRIWSSVTNDDAEVIVDILLQAGEVTVQGAIIVRKIIQYYDQARAGVILIPRIYRTII